MVALGGLPLEVSRLLLSPSVGGTGFSLVERVATAIQVVPGGLLAVADALPAVAFDNLIDVLSSHGASEPLEALLTGTHATTHPAAIVKLVHVFGRKGHEAVYKIGVRRLELEGRDPDEVAGTYTKTQDVAAAKYTEELVLRDASGDVQVEDDNVTLKTATYTGTKAYQLGLTGAGECVVKVVVRLKPQPGVTDAKVDEKKKEWLEGIESVWNNKLAASNGNAAYDLVFRPLFKARGFAGTVHFDVDVSPNDQRSDEGTWDVHDKGRTTAAHEFGHMLGNKDEYDQPVRTNGNVTDLRDERRSIMSDYGRVSERHVADILADFNAMMGNPTPPFVAVPKGAARKRKKNAKSVSKKPAKAAST